MTTYIYGLHDILDPEKKIRYVGKTTNLGNRLVFHRCANDRHRPVSKWVKGLITKGGSAAIVVLEETTKDKASTAEGVWINKLKPDLNVQLASHMPIIQAADGCGPFDKAVRDLETKLIVDALIASKWNKKKASIDLGIGRQTLYNKIAQYGITKPA